MEQRALTLGVEVVLMGGKTLELLGGLRKDIFFFRSEGTLGVIKATLRLLQSQLQLAQHSLKY